MDIPPSGDFEQITLPAYYLLWTGRSKSTKLVKLNYNCITYTYYMLRGNNFIKDTVLTNHNGGDCFSRANKSLGPLGCQTTTVPWVFVFHFVLTQMPILVWHASFTSFAVVELAINYIIWYNYKSYVMRLLKNQRNGVWYLEGAYSSYF